MLYTITLYAQSLIDYCCWRLHCYSRRKYCNISNQSQHTSDLIVRHKLNSINPIPAHTRTTIQLIKPVKIPPDTAILQDVFDLAHETIRLTELFHLNSFHKHDNIGNYCKDLGLKTNEFIEDSGVVATLDVGLANDLCFGVTCVINTHTESSQIDLLKTDCNIAILLTTANLLCTRKYCKKLKGNVKFIFDPGFKSESIISSAVFDGINQIYGFGLQQHYPFGTFVVTVDENNSIYEQFIRVAFEYTFGDSYKYVLNKQKKLMNITNSALACHDKYKCFIEIGCGQEIDSNSLIHSVQILIDLIMDTLVVHPLKIMEHRKNKHLPSLKSVFLSKTEILSLKEGDTVDYKMLNGYYCSCVVNKKMGDNTLKLQYQDESINMSITEDINNEQTLMENRFAYARSISVRPNNRFKQLKIGSVLGVRYCGQWEEATVVAKDDHSGQYKFCVHDSKYWFHLDDEDNVKIWVQ